MLVVVAVDDEVVDVVEVVVEVPLPPPQLPPPQLPPPQA